MHFKSPRPTALVVGVFAVLVGGGAFALVHLHDPWTARDWITNAVFVVGITILTGILARPQQRLQRAIADTEMLEKVAALTGFIDRFKRSVGSSDLLQLMMDMQAALQLFPMASKERRADILEACRSSISEALKEIRAHETAHSTWTPREWRAVARTAKKTWCMFEERVVTNGRREENFRKKIRKALNSLRNNPGQRGTVGVAELETWFSAKSGPEVVRPLLDWSVLKRAKGDNACYIEIHRHDTASFLSGVTVRPVWYFDSKGRFTAFDAHDAVTVSLSDVDEWSAGLPKEYLARIREFQERLTNRRQGVLPNVVVVTLKLPGEEVLVLDGNHRLAAIYLARPNWAIAIHARIVEYRINANLSAELLPDLIHYGF